MGLFSNSLSIILIFRFLTPNISLSPSLLSFSLSQFLNEYDQSRFSTIQSQFHFRSIYYLRNFFKASKFCETTIRFRTNVRDQTFRRNSTSNLFISRYKSRKNRRAKGLRNFSRNLPQLTSKRAESEKLTRRRFNNRDKSMRCRKYRNLSTRNFSFFHHRSSSTPAFIRPTIDYNTREKSSAETS